MNNVKRERAWYIRNLKVDTSTVWSNNLFSKWFISYSFIRNTIANCVIFRNRHSTMQRDTRDVRRIIPLEYLTRPRYIASHVCWHLVGWWETVGRYKGGEIVLDTDRFDSPLHGCIFYFGAIHSWMGEMSPSFYRR